MPLPHASARGIAFVELPMTVAKIGVAYAFQVVPKVPQEDHDQRLDVVLTD